MKRIGTLFALSALALSLTNAIGFAQHRHDGEGSRHDNHRYVEHREWKRGARMRGEDWARGERLDYRRYHLNAPPNGYEWRRVDGNYVMAAVATGVIATVIVASAVH